MQSLRQYDRIYDENKALVDGMFPRSVVILNNHAEESGAMDIDFIGIGPQNLTANRVGGKDIRDRMVLFIFYAADLIRLENIYANLF